MDLQDVKMFDLELGNQLERSPTEYLPVVSLLQQHCLGVLTLLPGQAVVKNAWKIAGEVRSRLLPTNKPAAPAHGL